VAPRAFIGGLAGPLLTEDERHFLRDAQPWGVILFARNIGAADEIRRLCADAREALGRDAPVLIDQEGGRVQRIGPPLVRAYPPGAAYAAIYAENPLRGVEAAHLGARLIALDLAALGVTINCAPVLDIPVEGGTKAIGGCAAGRRVPRGAGGAGFRAVPPACGPCPARHDGARHLHPDRQRAGYAFCTCRC
jgi:beta-N-acetylhexosaminidase